MKFTVTVKTATTTYCYTDIWSNSFDLWSAAFDKYGIAKISVVRV